MGNIIQIFWCPVWEFYKFAQIGWYSSSCIISSMICQQSLMVNYQYFLWILHDFDLQPDEVLEFSRALTPGCQTSHGACFWHQRIHQGRGKVGQFLHKPSIYWIYWAPNLTHAVAGEFSIVCLWEMRICSNQQDSFNAVLGSLRRDQLLSLAPSSDGFVRKLGRPPNLFKEQNEDDTPPQNCRGFTNIFRPTYTQLVQFAQFFQSLVFLAQEVTRYYVAKNV